MVDKSWRTFGVRASDLEREDAAHRIEAANGEGRLSLAEAEQRLALAYSATYRYELHRLVADLPSKHAPAPGPESRNAKVWLGVHAAVVAVLTGLLVYRWQTAGTAFFWPMAPLAVLTASLVAHAWFRLSGRFVGRAPLLGQRRENPES
ncbi:DUF1707 SHOCT-like domain-containing protein [Amycolatopsis taiwanensis]|uniref:DUF1707 domain-containing protein n=1 Tax=Amycolatopsis taiwanensis TaxID=342230 RepID=A0A9W6RAM4_9PSEU|nr:DUF1707 domain-containing protein [Amycolatopsis taiwanensis]GLY70587.1 hypothetical protein Atai01_72060 [Amycolatopsis taiwanensis]